MRLFFTIVLLIYWKFFFGQAPSILFSECYGGSEGDGGSSLIYTQDNGYLVVGKTISYNGDVTNAHIAVDTTSNDTLNWGDVWVIKFDIAGNIQWEKCFGGILPDDGVVVKEVSGGYVIGATIISWDGDITHNNGESDYWIFKIDYAGTLLWEKSYGGSVIENLYDIEEYLDGSILVIGDASSLDGDVTGHHGVHGSDAWLLKLDSLESLQWEKCFGGSMSESYLDVAADQNGNIYLFTSSSSNDIDITCNINSRNIWLSKLDSTGNILWSNCFGGSSNDILNSMRIIGNKILLSGYSASYDGDLNYNYGYYDAWILQVDTSGTLNFSKSFGGSLIDQFNDAVYTNDNKIIAAGSTKSDDFDVILNNPGFDAKDAWVVILDSTGNLLWQNSYGGSETEEISSIALDPFGNLIATGYSSSPNDGDITGFTGTPGVTAQVWLIKFDITSNLISNIYNKNIDVFPNPFTNQLNLYVDDSNLYSYSMTDLLGNQIDISIWMNGNYIHIEPVTFITEGIYFLNIENDKMKKSVKAVKF